jgi:predicted cupin superfamily sugar epimerase
MTEPEISIEYIIEHFHLQPLPVEGGLFIQTYLAEEMIPAEGLPGRYPAEPRSFGSAILYLFTPNPDSFSALHWVPTDEIYHFYLGDPVEMLLLFPNGTSRRILLGQDIQAGQHVQFMAPRGVIQGSHLLPGGRFALIGTTMAPAFDESDYHGGIREQLQASYPQEKDLIATLTRPGQPLEMELKQS